MAIADPNSWPEEAGPVILELPGTRVDEDMLLALARKNPKYRFETLADGRLVVTPLTFFFAAGGEVELSRQIANWNVEQRLGHVTGSSGGITLSDGAIKGPDATFTAHAKIAALPPYRKRRAFEQIAPDAVLSVDTGCGVAVLLNPRDQSVTLYRKNKAPIVLRDVITAPIGSEMPEFILDAAAVFAASEDHEEIRPTAGAISR